MSYDVLKRKYEDVKSDKNFYYNENKKLIKENKQLKKRVEKLERDVYEKNLLLLAKVDMMVDEIKASEEFGKSEEK